MMAGHQNPDGRWDPHPGSPSPLGGAVADDPLVGRTLGGRYQIEAVLGVGAVATVYRAADRDHDRAVAVKILSKLETRKARSQSRFVTEARILYRLRCRHTARLLDFGRLPSGRPYMVVEHVTGGHLHELLRGWRFDQISALRVAHQVCQALDEAHEMGVVHRDLKPENVMLEPVGDRAYRVKVLDFGLAKLQVADSPNGRRADLTALRETGPWARVGTPSYIAPEQAAGGRLVDGRADLYALGVILFEMLTGLQPFTAESHRALYFEHLYTPAPRLDEIVPDGDFDPEVVDLVDALLAKRPEDRPASANLVTRSIEAILSRLGLPVEVTGIRPVRHPSAERPAVPDATDDWDGADRWRRRTRRRVVARLVIVGGVLAGLVAGAIAMGWCAA